MMQHASMHVMGAREEGDGLGETTRARALVERGASDLLPQHCLLSCRESFGRYDAVACSLHDTPGFTAGFVC